MSNHTGWEREYRTHFDSIVAEYETIRPEWTSDIFADITKYAKPDQNKTAIEIGIGTGKATTPILNMGYNVTAIEINPQMAEFSANRFKAYNNFNIMISSFEDAPLDGNSYDLIYAASAFHWVDAEIGLPKALRLLKDGGAIALFRYNEIASVDDKLFNDLYNIRNQYYNHYYKLPYSQPIRKAHNDFYKPEEIYKGFRFESLQSYGFRDISMKFYDVTLEYTPDEYISLLNTLSDHRNLPDDIRIPFYSKTKEAIEASGGNYKIDYVFQLYLGRK